MDRTNGSAVAGTVGDPSAFTAIPPGNTELVDASGAGDCFDGAFLARLLAGETPQIAAHYAVTASSISVEGYGAIPTVTFASKVYENLTGFPSGRDPTVPMC